MTNSELTFTFKPVTKNQISSLKELLNVKTARKSTIIPTKFIRELSDFFLKFIYISHCMT